MVHIPLQSLRFNPITIRHLQMSHTVRQRLLGPFKEISTRSSLPGFTQVGIVCSERTSAPEHYLLQIELYVPIILSARFDRPAVITGYNIKATSYTDPCYVSLGINC